MVSYEDILRCKSDMSFLRLCDPDRAAYNHSKDKEWTILFNNHFLGRYLTGLNKLADTCCVSKHIASSWTNHQPHQREHIIALSCLYGLDPLSSKSNKISCSELLALFGFEPLNANNPEDVIYIFLLNLAKREESAYDNAEKQFTFLNLPYYKKTASIINREKNDISEYHHFEDRNDAVFCSTYFSVLKNNRMNAAAVRGKLIKKLSSLGYSSYEEFFAVANVPSAIQKECRCLFDDEDFPVFPPRNRFISLLLCMDMPLEEMNDILKTGNLSELSTVEPFEKVLVHILSQFFKQGDEVCYSTNNDKGYLYEYTREKLMSHPLSEFIEAEELDINELLPA